ncbi:urease accessory protein UreE [Xanthobacter sp. ZOL 2024]
MIRATAIVRRPAVRDEKVADAVTLDHRARQGRRFAFTTEGGLAIALELEKAVALDDGDAVKLEDGRLVRVRAAAEALMEVTSPNPARLLKAAWQLGQRHLPTESTETALYVPADGALMETLRGLGVSATPVTRPFRPDKATLEAAGAGHHHGHEHHGHEHHEHEHPAHEHPAHEHPAHEHPAHEHSAHEHAHHGHDHHHHEDGHHGHAHHAAEAAPVKVSPEHVPSPEHVHGPDCGHAHDHAHAHDHGHKHEHHEHEHSGHVHGPGCGHTHR